MPAVSLIVIGFNAAMFIVLKFNDMKHMEKKLDEIASNVKSIDAKQDSNAERIAKIEGKCTANHG